VGTIDKRRTARDTSQPPAAKVRAWQRHRWLLPLWCLVFAAYSNSFQAGLPFDNASVIAEDSRIQAATPQNVESILKSGYWYGNSPRAATSGLYRPLTTLSYLMNYAVLGNGTHTAGYHIVNLLLHEVNVALVYALGVLIFGETVPALGLAAIWGLHPLLTESVTSIVGRADLLAAFGVLAGLLCHVKAVSAAARRRVLWLVGLAAAQAVGLFSKENAAVLPGIMLLYDLLWRGPAAWRRRAVGYAVLALPFAAYFYLRSGSHPHMAIDLTDNPLVGAGFWTARLTAVKVVGNYLWLFLWPARLTADYSFNAVPLFAWRVSNWEDAQALLGLAACLGAVVLAVLLAVRWRRTGTPLLLFLIFFFVALAPTSNLIVFIGSIMAERFLYLPSIGLAGCVVAAVLALVSRRLPQRSLAPKLAWAALGIVCLACAARTYARNFDWQDDRTLWTSAVTICPEAARPHYNLGLELERIPERQFEAIPEYQAAVRIQPDFAEAHNNLANALARIPGRLTEAIAEYQAALQLRPGLAAAHLNLGNALARMPGRESQAIAEYQAALRIRPEFVEARAGLANALALFPDRVPEAIAQYQAALRLQPNRADVHYGLANVLARMPGRQNEAIGEYQAALRIQPDFMEAHFNLGNTLAKTPARLPEALAEYDIALKLRPDPQLQQIVDRLRSWQKQTAPPR
jgi:protein O-mannosyl-transferase